MWEEEVLLLGMMGHCEVGIQALIHSFLSSTAALTCNSSIFPRTYSLFFEIYGAERTAGD
jgi:hypothetical protein